MRRLARAARGLVLALGTGPAFAHGASHGLHLHVTPASARPGAEVEIAADAAAPIVSLRIAFVGETPTVVRPEAPSRRVVVRLRVPAQVKATVVNVQAEAEVGASKPLRASAVVQVVRAGSAPTAGR